MRKLKEKNKQMNKEIEKSEFLNGIRETHWENH